MRKSAIITVVSLLCVGTLAFALLPILGCDEEGLINPNGEVDIPPPPSEGFQAVDFPTTNGSAWTYVNVDTGQEFTQRIEGTRDISGVTTRQMTISELSPTQTDSLNREPVDELSANALYFRLDSDFFPFPFPLLATYFLKRPHAYIESAFDAFIPVLDPPIAHQKHFPPRLIWDFPLTVGKQWTVFEKTVLPVQKVVRRVIQADVPVSVPAGRYDTYLVEEEIIGLSEVEAFKPVGDSNQLEPATYEPAKYWVAPNVGVVKYQYTYLTPAITANQETINLLQSATFELEKSELPGVSSP